ATYVKARRDHHIVSVAVIVAVGVNSDGRREVLGMTVGHSEAEPFWVEFLRSLARRGLRGAKLVISDAHEGLKAAIACSIGRFGPGAVQEHGLSRPVCWMLQGASALLDFPLSAAGSEADAARAPTLPWIEVAPD